MLYEVTLQGRYFNQQVINRWNYLSTGTPAVVTGAFGLAYAFGAIPDGLPPLFPSDSILAAIRQMTTSTMIWTSLTVRAASDYAPTDFYEAPFGTGLTGNQPAQGESPTVAFGFRTNIVRTDIRRATKRFAGVGEDVVDAGGVITAGGLGNMTDLAEKMSAVLSYDDEGSVISYAPCVVSKELYHPEPGKNAYRYYPTLSEQLEHVALGIVWSPYTTTRTQTSRQYGRGA